MNKWIHWAALWAFLLLGAEVFAQPVKPFQGSFSYTIRVSGKDAQAFLLDEPSNRMDLHIGDGNYIVHLMGGQKPKSFMFLGDSNHTYVVDAPNKRLYLRDYYRDTTTVVPTAVRTGNSLTIKGINCEEFKMVRGGQEILFYASSAFSVDISKYKGKEEAQADFLVNGLEGRVPLRKVIKSPNLTIELDVTKMESKVLDPENFVIPKGFKIMRRDHR